MFFDERMKKKVPLFQFLVSFRFASVTSPASPTKLKFALLSPTFAHISSCVILLLKESSLSVRVGWFCL